MPEAPLVLDHRAQNLLLTAGTEIVPRDSEAGLFQVITNSEAHRLRYPAAATALIIGLMFGGVFAWIAFGGLWDRWLGPPILWYALQHITIAVRIVRSGPDYLNRADEAKRYALFNAVIVGVWIRTASLPIMSLLSLPAFVVIDQFVRRRLFKADPRIQPIRYADWVWSCAGGECFGFAAAYVLRLAVGW